jgi:hypothetical protein
LNHENRLSLEMYLLPPVVVSRKPLFGLTALENLSDMSMLRQIGLLNPVWPPVSPGFAVVLWSQQPDCRPLRQPRWYGRVSLMETLSLPISNTP